MNTYSWWRRSLVLLTVMLVSAVLFAGRTSADDPSPTPDSGQAVGQANSGTAALHDAGDGAHPDTYGKSDCGGPFGTNKPCQLWEGFVVWTTWINDSKCPGNINVTYDWGDGTAPTTLSMPGDCGGTVYAPHLYGKDEQDKVTLTISQTDRNIPRTAVFHITFTEGDTLVSDPSKLPQNPIKVEAKKSRKYTVAHFKNTTYRQHVVADFRATIDWGDKTPPDKNATIKADNGDIGDFTVSGTHEYEEASPPDGGFYTITVTVKDDDNIGKATTPTAGLEIVDAKTGDRITEKQPKRTVVGKHMQLLLAMNDGSNITDPQWTVPSIGGPMPAAIKQYDVEHGVDPVNLTDDDLSQEHLDFYWVQRGSGQYTVEAEATVDGQTLKAKGKFEVAAPTVTNQTPLTCGIGIHSPSPHDAQPLWNLILGFNTRCNNLGIRYNFGVSNPMDGGSFALTQFINIDANQLGPGAFTTHGQFQFDNSTFYHNHQVGVPGTYVDSDGPALPLCHPTGGQAASWALLRASFETYWMFRPTGDDSIWVPLGEVLWSFEGHADGRLHPPDATHTHAFWTWTLHPGFTDPHPHPVSPVPLFTVADKATFGNPAFPGCDAT